MLSLEWADIDLSQEPTVRLRIENSKNKEARVLPLEDRLLEIIQAQAADRRLDCRHVFHRNYKPLGDIKKAWRTACIKSGVGHMERQEDGRMKYVGTIPHDLRRCAARNMSRAGVPEVVAMSLTGHKTNAMYKRYRIVVEDDLREATARMQSHLNSQPAEQKVVPLAVNERNRK